MSAFRCFPASKQCVPSPDGALIAIIDHSHLTIRIAKNGGIICSYPLPSEFVLSCRFLRWFIPRHRAAIDASLETGEHRQLLVADDKKILIYNVNDPQWQAQINSAVGDINKIANVDWGNTSEEVLVSAEFGVKATIWSLATGRGVEIRDPKLLSYAYDYQGRTGHLAILTRPIAHDVLIILGPGTHEQTASVELPTVDARGLKWSPNGQWLAIWDTASAGSRLLIYTADGYLFRTYSGARGSDAIELGIKSVEWSPSSDCIALGDFSNNVTILTSTIYSVKALFLHRSGVSSPESIVWQEEIDAIKDRSYTIARQPALAPTSESLATGGTEKSGISVLAFNEDASLLATRSDSLPSTIWIWSLTTAKLAAVLIHHESVKSIQWHPFVRDLLLVHCATADPTVHVWRESWDLPQIFRIRNDELGAITSVGWLATEGDVLKFILNGANLCAIGQMTVHGQLVFWAEENDQMNEISGLGPEDMFDEGNSFELSPVKLSNGDIQEDLPGNTRYSEPEPTTASDIDDTFYYRNQKKATT